jgi:hypothetical protein
MTNKICGVKILFVTFVFLVFFTTNAKHNKETHVVVFTRAVTIEC